MKIELSDETTLIPKDYVIDNVVREYESCKDKF